MNNKLFYTGLTFQGIQLVGISLLILSNLDWSFVTTKFILIGTWLMYNLISILMILYGAIKGEGGKDQWKKK